jgi:hypothetical protein
MESPGTLNSSVQGSFLSKKPQEHAKAQGISQLLSKEQFDYFEGTSDEEEKDEVLSSMLCWSFLSLSLHRPISSASRCR